MTESCIPPIDPSEQLPFQNIDETDFVGMSRTEQIRHFEIEGYVVLPEILDTGTIGRLKKELSDAEMTHRNLNMSGVQWVQPHKPVNMRTESDAMAPDCLDITSVQAKWHCRGVKLRSLAILTESLTMIPVNPAARSDRNDFANTLRSEFCTC